MTRLSRLPVLGQVGRARLLLAFGACALLACTSSSTPAPTSGSAPAVASSAPSVSSSPVASPSPALLVPSPSAGTSGSLTHVTAAWVAIAVTMMPALMAQEGGYFQQQGLDVDLQYIAGSGNAMGALLSGGVDVAEVAGSAVVAAVHGGGTPRMVAGFVNRPVFIALTVPSITDPSQLKGTTWAVTGIGSSDYFDLVAMLSHFGLTTSDVTIVASNDTTGQIAAVQNGAAQGLMVSPPNDVQAQKIANVHPFFDTSTLGVDEQNAGLAVSTTYGAAHADTLEKFIAACTLGIQRFDTDETFAEQVMQKYLKYTDQDVMDSGWQYFAPVFEKVPYPTDAGMQRIIDQVAAQSPSAASLTPADVNDPSYVQALDQTGFFTQVWGPGVSGS